MIAADGELFDLSSSASLWWRRPFGIEAPHELENAQPRPIVSEAVSALSATVNCVNDPYAQRAADNKARQLVVARQTGLSIPATIISESEKGIAKFAANYERVVFKDVTRRGHKDINPTRFLQIESCGMAVGRIVQEFIFAVRELRVICIDGSVFATQFDISAHSSAPDIREIDGIEISHASIPLELKEALVRFCQRLSLRYAAFDIREGADGYYFLEVNTAGEWLYVDQVHGGKITACLISALIGE